MTIDIHTAEKIAQLRWSCRRGMLELDLLLGRFLDQHFQDLAAEEQALFQELLAFTDQELFAWLLGGQAPQNPRFIPLLKKINLCLL